jgi:hypothetical protein
MPKRLGHFAMTTAKNTIETQLWILGTSASLCLWGMISTYHRATGKDYIVIVARGDLQAPRYPTISPFPGQSRNN